MISTTNSLRRAAILAFAFFAIGALVASAAPAKTNVVIMTQRNPTNGTIAANSNVHSLATVSDSTNGANGQNEPSGTVQFYVCHKNTGTANDYPSCTSSADGVIFGSDVSLTDCNNGACTVPSTNFVTGTNGTYCFLAVYSGDVKFNPAADATTPRINDCFFITSATAVTVSSMNARSMEEGGTVGMWGPGALSIATLGAAAFVFARKR